MANAEDRDAVDRMLTEIEDLLKRQQGSARAPVAGSSSPAEPRRQERRRQTQMEVVRPPHDADYRSQIGGSMDRQTREEPTRPPRVTARGGEAAEPDTGETVVEDSAQTLEHPVTSIERSPTETRSVDQHDAGHRLVEVDPYQPEALAIPTGDVADDDADDEVPDEEAEGNAAGAEIVAAPPEPRGADEASRVESAAAEVSATSAAPSSRREASEPVPPPRREASEPVSPPRREASEPVPPPRREASEPVPPPKREASEPVPPPRREAPEPVPAATAESATPTTPTTGSSANSITTEPADDSPGEAGHPAAAIGDPDGSHMTRRLSTRLGRLLLDAGLLSEGQLEAALERQQETGGRLGAVLVAEGYLDEADLLDTLEKQYGVPSARLDDLTPDPELIKLVPHEMARRNLVVPLRLHTDSVDVAMVDPTDFVTMAHLRFATGLRPNVFITTVAAALRTLERMYGEDTETQHEQEPPIDRRAAIKQMILDRDAVLLSADPDPRMLYKLAISIEAFVDEILRKADAGK